MVGHGRLDPSRRTASPMSKVLRRTAVPVGAVPAWDRDASRPRTTDHSARSGASSAGGADLADHHSCTAGPVPDPRSFQVMACPGRRFRVRGPHPPGAGGKRSAPSRGPADGRGARPSHSPGSGRSSPERTSGRRLGFQTLNLNGACVERPTLDRSGSLRIPLAHRCALRAADGAEDRPARRHVSGGSARRTPESRTHTPRRRRTHET